MQKFHSAPWNRSWKLNFGPFNFWLHSALIRLPVSATERHLPQPDSAGSGWNRTCQKLLSDQIILSVLQVLSTIFGWAFRCLLHTRASSLLQRPDGGRTGTLYHLHTGSLKLSQNGHWTVPQIVQFWTNIRLLSFSIVLYANKMWKTKWSENFSAP